MARVLHSVPIAALAALFLPGLSLPVEIAPRLVPALFIGAVAWRVGKRWVALLVGMTVYWGLRAVGL